MGRRQIPQHRLRQSCLHHRKADIGFSNEALPHQAAILILIDDVAANVLAVDQFAKIAASCDATAPYLPVFQSGLIALASIDRRYPDSLIPDADGVAIDHAGTAGIIRGLRRTVNDDKGGEKRRQSVTNLDTAKGAGLISTIDRDMDIKVVPFESDNEKAPTHRVYAKSPRGHDIEVGGIWKKENQDGKPYYTLSIRKLRYNANLGRFPGQDDASLQAIIEWEPRD